MKNHLQFTTNINKDIGNQQEVTILLNNHRIQVHIPY